MKQSDSSPIERWRYAHSGYMGALLLAVGWVSLVGCGGRAKSDGTVGETNEAGGSTTPSGGGHGAVGGRGGAGGSTESGGAAGEPPLPVDPEVTRSWRWEPCGTLEPEPADSAALIDALGRVVVLGTSGLRLYEADGTRVDLPAAVPADFLVTDVDGSVLSGRTTADGFALTPVGQSAPSIELTLPPGSACGPRIAISTDGDYVLATGDGRGCAWRVSDSSFVGSIGGEQVTIRDSLFVSVESGPVSKEVVQRDFAGQEVSRLAFGEASVVLSPAGDRVFTTGDHTLVDVDSGDVLDFNIEPSIKTDAPIFSTRGEMLLLGDGVYSTADAVRRFEVETSSRLAVLDRRSLALAPDGSRAVSYGFGRATLFDVEAPGVLAVLGPPVLPPSDRHGRGTTDIALSRDGALLAYNLDGAAAYGVRLAPRFVDSHVVFDMRVELNSAVDVSTDGKLTTVGGDGRAVYAGQDGRAIWPALPPPPDVPAGPFCLQDRVRFSPKATWLAGSDYTGGLQIFPMNGGGWQPLLEVPGSCDAAVFTRDDRLMATSAAALYRTGASKDDWSRVWSSPLPPTAEPYDFTTNNVTFSPDETQLLVSRCSRWNASCATTLLNVETGKVDRELTELTGPDPAFSPEGTWIVAADKVLHLASGETRSLREGASPNNPAIFTPEGDIIAGSATGALTRYCREE